MKACPKCYRLYPEDAGFCPVDGGKLEPYASVSHQTVPNDGFLGTTIGGRYEMRRIVADGGMGRVYEARDATLDRRVAIKVLHPEVARDPVAVERFRREYEISKDLPHDYIVEVIDFQQIGTNNYIMVMEFLDGEELRTILKRDRTLEPARVIRILSQVAIGLDEAHRRQFVHRDLKPDNVFCCGTSEGEIVKLLDFGSVRINKNRARSKLTSLGTTIGSPYYMSPEQAQGAEALDHRADVFALGAIVYECLSGQVPFSGANGPAILLAILTKTPAPLTTRADKALNLPAAIDDVIDDALAKKPETRTSSVGALADALGRAFGLTADHLRWATLPVANIRREIEEARSQPPNSRGVPVVEADPFAPPPPHSPPHSPAGVAPAGARAIAAPTQSASVTAREAMDDAFAAALGGEIVGVPGRMNGMLVAAIIAVVAVVAGIVVLLVK